MDDDYQVTLKYEYVTSPYSNSDSVRIYAVLSNNGSPVADERFENDRYADDNITDWARERMFVDQVRKGNVGPRVIQINRED